MFVNDALSLFFKQLFIVAAILVLFMAAEFSDKLAAGSVAALAEWSAVSPALRPLWTLLNAGALVLGGWLLLRGRQPAWMARLGRGPALKPVAGPAGSGRRADEGARLPSTGTVAAATSHSASVGRRAPRHRA